MAYCVVLAPACLFAQVPKLLRYQGQAVDSNGVPLEGPYTLTFRLYDAQTAGTTLWEEAQPNVPLSGGYFSVLLGQVTSLGAMNWGNPCWLSIQVNADPELAPRQQLTSVPTAIKAEKAEQLEGPLTISGNKVGIGTTTPQTTLEVAGPTGSVKAFSTTGTNPAYTWIANGGGDMAFARDDSLGKSFFTHGSSPYAGVITVDGPYATLHVGTYGTIHLTVASNHIGQHFVGIGTPTPDRILTVQQGSDTDPIADSWTVYASDRRHKQILRTNPTGHLARIKQLPVYEWTRLPTVSDDEALSALNDTGSMASKFDGTAHKAKPAPTAADLAQKKQELKAAKAQRVKFTTKRVGMAIDDPEVPPELLTYHEDGSTAGIDLLAYLGYLHAALKEAALQLDESALKIEALEARLPDTQGKSSERRGP